MKMVRLWVVGSCCSVVFIVFLSFALLTILEVDMLDPARAGSAHLTCLAPLPHGALNRGATSSGSLSVFQDLPIRDAGHRLDHVAYAAHHAAERIVGDLDGY